MIEHENIDEEDQGMFDEETMARVDAGFDRLSRALTPRLERYKVELFINLCQMLESDEEGDQFEQEGEGEQEHGQDM